MPPFGPLVSASAFAIRVKLSAATISARKIISAFSFLCGFQQDSVSLSGRRTIGAGLFRQAFEGFAAVGQEQQRRQQGVERGRAEQAAENRHRDRVQNLTAGFVGTEEQWGQRKARRQRR